MKSLSTSLITGGNFNFHHQTGFVHLIMRLPNPSVSWDLKMGEKIESTEMLVFMPYSVKRGLDANAKSIDSMRAG